MVKKIVQPFLRLLTLKHHQVFTFSVIVVLTISTCAIQLTRYSEGGDEELHEKLDVQLQYTDIGNL